MIFFLRISIIISTDSETKGVFQLSFNFYMPVKVVSGKGCVAKNSSQLSALGKKCLIITGKSSALKSGALHDITAALDAGPISYQIFDKIGPNPLLSACFEAGKTAREQGADFIIGIGGGSALDAAKSAAIFAGNPDLQPMDIFSGEFKNPALPLALAGTTAGTGSEVTAVSVLTIDGQNVKKSVTHPYCYARISFADPRYTYSSPYGLTVSAALDALSHAVESYYSIKGGDTARGFSLEAVALLWPNLLKLLENKGALPDEESRDELYFGSLWAGLALNLSGTGFPHPAGYALTTGYGVPHGKACAVFLPDYVRHNAPADKKLSQKLFSALGTDLDDFCKKVRALTDVNHIKMTPEECKNYGKKLEGRKNLTNAVNPSTADEVEKIYEKLFC